MNLNNFADQTYHTQSILGKKRKVPEVEINKFNKMKKMEE